MLTLHLNIWTTAKNINCLSSPSLRRQVSVQDPCTEMWANTRMSWCPVRCTRYRYNNKKVHVLLYFTPHHRSHFHWKQHKSVISMIKIKKSINRKVLQHFSTKLVHLQLNKFILNSFFTNKIATELLKEPCDVKLLRNLRH